MGNQALTFSPDTVTLLQRADQPGRVAVQSRGPRVRTAVANPEGVAMQGSFLRLYLHEGQRHQGRPAWEWLLEQANVIGIRGGSAFRAMAGVGRHHKLCEAKLFELAGSLAVEVEFIVTDEEA